ncbi:Rid family hydrolase [Bradyrhizobium sp. Gha]|uniref:Rid family hydrolase n=1 Tax=Bradyrhizobium sp. Gha TaxID=1855318 RepID=UPI0008E17421|nr:Rid family hydrolase [Bradyrhizobium sp. Gha]SFK10557.1 Endoribonuclease L-PSP [Bradyrhizobium sp. Gha]
MNKLSKAALVLMAVLGLAYATPVAAGDEQVYFYNAPPAIAAKFPISLAVRVGDILYLSGFTGVLPGKPELAPGGIEPETTQIMQNIGNILRASGLTFDDVFNALRCLQTVQIGCVR